MGVTAGDDVYELRPRKDKDGFELINDGFRYGPIWYSGRGPVRYANMPYTCAQMLGYVYRDNTYRMNGGVAGSPATILTNAINIGVGYQNRYQEIYEIDVINLPGVITHAHSVIGH